MNERDEIDAFCKNIKYLRIKNGVSKNEMANIMHISMYCLTKIEKGILPPSLDVAVLFRIHAYFGVPPARLFSKIEENTDS
ncbi:MAG: helix-turn-helix transcriptional regulator [Clostridia bacterium]|nr:helix-turn-helix transcriptional regulator [Clostridia bacterium]